MKALPTLHEPTTQSQKTPGQPERPGSVTCLGPAERAQIAERLRSLPTLPGVCGGLLWHRGDAQVLRREPVLTVVGSRAASRAAEALAEQLGQAAAEQGVLVVSGGALGVDAAAHRGALRAGGPTVAVLGTGVDVAYPRRHAGLFQKIAAAGCLLSMFPPGTDAATWHFPVRNRLMAALAHAVVVIEAQADSGSLITAREALRLGRRVLTFRGSPGTDRLLSSGAVLVRSIDDVLRVLRACADGDPAGVPVQTPPPEPGHAAGDGAAWGLGALEPAGGASAPDVLNPADPIGRWPGAGSESGPDAGPDAGPDTGLDAALDGALLALLAAAAAPLSVDALCASTGRNAADCAAALVGLELRGRCTRLAGGRFIVHAPLS